MKRIVLMCAAVLAVSAGSAHAAAFTTNFCPGDDTCPTGITQARVVFDEILTGTDPNDYNLYVVISGNASAPAFINAIDFTITGVTGAAGAGINDYELLPTLLSAPAGTWGVSFDKINNGGACNGAGAGQAVCVDSAGVGTANNAIGPNTVNIWQLLVDLDSGVPAITTATTVDLRVSFLTAQGGNAGILSPGAQPLDQPCVGCVPGLQDVPEPTSIVLLGLGLLGAGLARRRKQ